MIMEQLAPVEATAAPVPLSSTQCGGGQRGGPVKALPALTIVSKPHNFINSNTPASAASTTTCNSSGSSTCNSSSTCSSNCCRATSPCSLVTTSPRALQSPVHFHMTSPNLQYPPCSSSFGGGGGGRSPLSPNTSTIVSCYSQHQQQQQHPHIYTSQHNNGGGGGGMPFHYTCNNSSMGRFPANTIIVNPAGATPVGGGGYNGPSHGSVTPGRITPGRITPGRITPGRCTPVYAMNMKKRYVDIMLASSASTVAIDNKIEQAMDLVKSHLMFAVREEVDVLKERIGELMERINHLEYENTVLRKYATQEALQQLQHHNPNP